MGQKGKERQKYSNCDVVKGNMSPKTERKQKTKQPLAFLKTHNYTDMEQVRVQGNGDGGTLRGKNGKKTQNPEERRKLRK